MSKHIKRLNALLRTELGTTGGIYAWKWSEDREMMRPMRVTDPDGKPVLKYVDLPSGLTVAEPVYTMRKVAINADHQWMLARLLPPALSEHQWSQLFGTSQVYPVNGEWAPCDPVYLKQGDEPCEADTWDAIGWIKSQRRTTDADLDALATAALERRDRGKSDEIEAVIKDAAPAFLNVPGMKGHVSFPTAGK